jgi:hypothetical protein
VECCRWSMGLVTPTTRRLTIRWVLQGSQGSDVIANTLGGWVKCEVEATHGADGDTDKDAGAMHGVGECGGATRGIVRGTRSTRGTDGGTEAMRGTGKGAGAMWGVVWGVRATCGATIEEE